MNVLAALAAWLKPAPPLEPAVCAALARTAERIDPLLSLAPGFERRLAGPVRQALDYCARLVAALPGPLAIDRRAFANDPLIHALFATADEVEQMLGRSRAIRDYLAGPDSPSGEHFHALLAARPQQKRQLGVEQVGEIVRTEVPQTVLYFSDQTLIEPHGRLEETLTALRGLAFDSLLQSFHDHLVVLREENAGLRADLALQRAYPAETESRIAPGTRRLDELGGRLRRNARALEPEQLIDALADYLTAPEEALRLTPTAVTVDRLGVVRQGATDDGDVHTLEFPELTGRDRRRHLVALVRIRYDEARQAVAAVRDAQQRYMVL